MKIKNSQVLQFKNSSQQCYFRLLISNLHLQLNFVKRKKKESTYTFEIVFFPGAVASSKQPGNPKRL